MKTTRTDRSAPIVGACIRCSGTGTLFGGACFLCEGDCLRLYGAPKGDSRGEKIATVAALLKGFDAVASDDILSKRPKTCKRFLARAIRDVAKSVNAADIDVFDRAFAALGKHYALNLGKVAESRAAIVGEVSCAA